LVLLSYTALSLGFVYAVLYLILARQLMRRRFGLLFRRLPSLDTLERMSVGAVELGVPLLFLSLCLGHLWMYDLRDRVTREVADQLSPFDPKILMAWLVLLIYSVGLAGHRLLGWRGRRMSVMAVAAYVAVVVATGLIHHLFPSFHNFRSTGARVELTVLENVVRTAGHLTVQSEGRR
jgi:HemX protein